MDTSRPTDDDALDLVRRCLEGQEQAQRELMRRYAGLCHRIASRVLGGRHRSYVEDAVQEALYAAFAKLDQWQGHHFAAWLGTIAARRALDLRRRLRRTGAETAGLDAADVPAPPQPAGATRLAELRDAIRRARPRMTDRQQRILDALLEGQTRGQIAQRLGVSARTVYYELDAIRRRLHDALGTIADRDESERLY